MPLLAPRVQVEDQDPQSEQLPYPGMVGRPQDRITDYENDPVIIGIERQLRCTCGCNLDVYTCRTTDFTCGTSPAMHRDVVELVEQGSTAQEVIDAFIGESGEMVLMAPKKEGFNIVGYVLPGVAIAGVGAAMLWVLSRRDRTSALPAAVASDPGPNPEISEEEAARLESELTDLERY
jgi:cytochrome c-type biogenesis protein CcmH